MVSRITIIDKSLQNEITRLKIAGYSMINIRDTLRKKGIIIQYVVLMNAFTKGDIK